MNCKKTLETLENIYYFFLRFIDSLIYFPKRIRFFFQRGKRGYSDCDTWGLDSYLLSWLPKAIRDLRDCRNSYPADTTFKKWQSDLTRMAKGFDSGERIINSFNITEEKSEKWKKEFDEGFKLFHKHFFSLWD